MFACVSPVVRFGVLDDRGLPTPLLRLLHGRHGRPGRVIGSSIPLASDSHLELPGVRPYRVRPISCRAITASLHGALPTC